MPSHGKASRCGQYPPPGVFPRQSSPRATPAGAKAETGFRFPSKYRGGAFLAYHGSSNRAQRVGYSVVFIPFRKGKPAGEPEEFLTGFMLDKDKADVWGRPVAILEVTDGSILVSDDGGNKIWRISYTG
jgi:glucose/arabinose dehydrogenase